MKEFLIISIFYANSLIASSVGQASCYDNPKFFSCIRSDDCVLVEGRCGENVAVNKEMSKDATNCFRVEGASIGCPVPAPQKAEAVCAKQKCVVEKLGK
jgi:hypothetical protein